MRNIKILLLLVLCSSVLMAQKTQRVGVLGDRIYHPSFRADSAFFNSSVNMGLGVVEITATGRAQLRLIYDVSNNAGFAVNSDGSMQLGITGSNLSFWGSSDHGYDLGKVGGSWRTGYVDAIDAIATGTVTSIDRQHTFYIYNGSGTTVTLPALSATYGIFYIIKNRGSGNLVIQRAGSDNLYTTTSVTSITVAAGATAQLFNDQSFWEVLLNQ